ncbi:glutaredoxin [Candidatus Woesearchaeota archaeon]|nr:glutaredoxin [Candidatus Woesearchaeota archaeon]
MVHKELVLFRLEGCPYCRKAEEALKNKGVKYKKIEVMPAHEDRKILKQISGQTSVPVLLQVIGAKDQDDEIIQLLEEEY